MKKIRNKKALMILLLIIALTAVGGALYVKLNQKADLPKTEQEKLKEEESAAKDYVPTKNDEAYASQQKAKQQSRPSSSANIYFSSISQDDDNLYINAIVSQQTSGTCTLTLTKAGSQTITRTAPLGMVTSYYSCQGFTLKKTEFSSIGDWVASVSFTNGVSKGETPAQRITIEK